MKRIIKNFIDYLLAIDVNLLYDYRLKSALLSALSIWIIMAGYYFIAHLETTSLEYHDVVMQMEFPYLSGNETGNGIMIKNLDSEKTVAESAKYKITATEKDGKFRVLHSEYKISLFEDNIIIYIPLDIPCICFILVSIVIFVIVFIQEEIAERKE